MNTLRLTLTMLMAAALMAPASARADDDTPAPAPVTEIAPIEDEAPAEKPEFDPEATAPERIEVDPAVADPAQEAEEAARLALEQLEIAPVEVPMKKVAFLGVATQPADADARAELKLPEGIGLNVVHVVPNTPAADAGVQPGDVLHKLGDQLLVNPDQLRTLIRTHKAGDAITLTVVRAGKPLELKTKLIEREVPANEPPAPGAWQVQPGDIQQLVPGQRLHIGPDGIVEIGPLELAPGGEAFPEDVRERIEAQRREMIKRIKQMQEQIEQQGRLAPPAPGAPGVAAQATATTVMNDGEHNIKYSITNGKKHLTVKDKEGIVLFEGPVNTDAEREKVPAELRQKFERLEKKMNINIRIMPDPFGPAPEPAPADDDEVVG